MMAELLLFQLRGEGRLLYRRAVRAAKMAFSSEKKESSGGMGINALNSLLEEIRTDVRRRRKDHFVRLDAWQRKKVKSDTNENMGERRGATTALDREFLSRERFELAEAKRRVEELEMMLRGIRM